MDAGIRADRLVAGEAGVCAEFLFGDDLVRGLVLVADDLDAGGEQFRRWATEAVMSTYANVVELHDGGLLFGLSNECLRGGFFWPDGRMVTSMEAKWRVDWASGLRRGVGIEMGTV